MQHINTPDTNPFDIDEQMMELAVDESEDDEDDGHAGK
jgi:hypothetical protein